MKRNSSGTPLYGQLQALEPIKRALTPGVEEGIEGADEQAVEGEMMGQGKKDGNNDACSSFCM